MDGNNGLLTLKKKKKSFSKQDPSLQKSQQGEGPKTLLSSKGEKSDEASRKMTILSDSDHIKPKFKC